MAEERSGKQLAIGVVLGFLVAIALAWGLKSQDAEPKTDPSQAKLPMSTDGGEARPLPPRMLKPGRLLDEKKDRSQALEHRLRIKADGGTGLWIRDGGISLPPRRRE